MATRMSQSASSLPSKNSPPTSKMHGSSHNLGSAVAKKKTKDYTGRIYIFTGKVAKEQCNEAKQLIKDAGGDASEIKVDTKKYLVDIMVKLSNGRTDIPQIFFNDTHIGGLQELKDLESNGQLHELVEEAKNADDPGKIYKIYRRQTDIFYLSPTDLYFPPPLNRPVVCVVRIVNKTEKYAIFKLKTNSPKRYIVKPKQGLLAPGAQERVEVILQKGLEEIPSTLDKFRVEGVVLNYVNEGLLDMVGEMFEKVDPKTIIMQRLSCKFENPPSNMKITQFNDGAIMVEELNFKPNFVEELLGDQGGADDMTDVKTPRQNRDDDDDLVTPVEDPVQQPSIPIQQNQPTNDDSMITDEDDIQEQKRQRELQRQQDKEEQERREEIQRREEERMAEEKRRREREAEAERIRKEEQVRREREAELQREQERKAQEQKELLLKQQQQLNQKQEEERILAEKKEQERKLAQQQEQQRQLLLQQQEQQKLAAQRQQQEKERQEEERQRQQLASVAQETKQLVEERATGREQRQEMIDKIDRTEYEKLSVEYRNVSEKLKTVLQKIKTLEQEHENELQVEKDRIAQLERQLSSEQMLRKRSKMEQEDTEKPVDKKRPPAQQLQAIEGYSLIILIVIAILSFLVGKLI